MKKIKRVKKAYKEYGTVKGDTYLKLFYTFLVKEIEIKGNDHGREWSDYRTVFNQYIVQKYGWAFFDEYWIFYLSNKDNRRLFKALDKKNSVFLDHDVFNLSQSDEKSDQKYRNQLEYKSKKTVEPIKQKEIKKSEGQKAQAQQSFPVVRYKVDEYTGEKKGVYVNVNGKWEYTSFIPERTAHRIIKYDGIPISADDTYKYRTAMDDIMMTNNTGRSEVVFICPVCNKKVRTVIRLYREEGRLVEKSICPICKKEIIVV